MMPCLKRRLFETMSSKRRNPSLLSFPFSIVTLFYLVYILIIVYVMVSGFHFKTCHAYKREWWGELKLKPIVYG